MDDRVPRIVAASSLAAGVRMAKTSRDFGTNALLAALPPDERGLLAPELERVPLEFKEVLQRPERPIDHVWFPHNGVCSATSTLADGEVVELATIGREGLVGVPLVLDDDQVAHAVFVQVPGEADRLPAATFVRMQERLPALRRLLLRYTLAFVTQVAQGAACNRIHPIEQRCARWLLMTHDRVDGDTFPLTQEFLGQMLGVSRPSVSIAAGILQKAGLIRYVRGQLTILDRAGLEAGACECYRVITGEFHRLLGRQG